MLRACRRLLRPGGRLGFFTILLAPELGPRDRRRAVRAGPRAVAVRGGDTATLLRRAGFAEIREEDVSAEYLTTAKAGLELMDRHQEELRVAWPDRFDEMLPDARLAVAAITEGLLRRSLFLARRPDPSA